VAPVEFVTMTDRGAAPDVLRMMHALYDGGGADTQTEKERFPATIERLLEEPWRGRIVLFVQQDVACGYAILIPYWSNEFGGVLLFVDELFVDATMRGQGVAQAFFAFVDETRPYDAVALALEVAPRNNRARALYERMGFSDRYHGMMVRRLASNSGMLK
jgi:GNAT superfamily N-acetyltransferase